MSRPDQVMLFMAHRVDRWSVRQFRKLEREAGGLAEIVWLWHEGAGADRGPPGGVPVFRVRDDVGEELGYPRARPGIFPGQQVMAVISFARSFPGYRHYWFVEFDVWCRDWRRLLEAAGETDSDLLATHVTEYGRCPAWYWWDRLEGELAELERRFLRKAFFPLYRISRGALEAVDEAYRSGAWAHNEIVVPTVIARKGLSVSDLRGLGRATGGVRPWYTGAVTGKGQMSSGSFRYRPSFLPAGVVFREEAELYHPVKPWSWWLRHGRLVEPMARALRPRRLVSRLPLLWRLVVPRHRE